MYIRLAALDTLKMLSCKSKVHEPNLVSTARSKSPPFYQIFQSIHHVIINHCMNAAKIDKALELIWRKNLDPFTKKENNRF